MRSLASGTTHAAFLRFDLGTLPEGVEVQKATLRMWVRGVNVPGPLVVIRVHAPWSEGTLTFAAQPFPQVAETQTDLTNAHAENFALLDVTPLVRAWAAGEPNYGLAVVAPVGDALPSVGHL